jgi:integrase
VAAEASAHLSRLGVTAADSYTFLFQAPRGGPLRATNFRSRIWRPALKAAHLAGLTFQDLRRTAMTLWGESGLPPRAIQLLAGHSDPRLSQAIYQQVTESLHMDTAERLGNLWKLTDGSADNQKTG